MTYFALLWKARTIEKYRLRYEKEKINSIMMANIETPRTNLFQKWKVYRYDANQRVSTIFKKLYPKGSGISNFLLYLRTDQTFPNLVLKSFLGFVGGIILTYLCFMFFVFQLSLSLAHATIMSSIIGVLLTLGLAFSYRIRCLFFLLIPQFFSRVGRYTLTCYALVLILTGPATNTLKNSEVLSESMACSQEQIKTSVHEIRSSIEKPLNAVKDSLKLIIEKMNVVALKVKKMLISLNRLVMSVVHAIQSSFSWLDSTAKVFNKNVGTPYERCINVLKDGEDNCKESLGPQFASLCSVAYVAYAACTIVKPYNSFSESVDYADGAIAATIKKKLKNFNDRIRAMLFVDVHVHHSYSFSSNTSRSASQVAAGIVTEIRNRADPLLTWLSWSSCVTSLFLLLIIFRAKYYQHMYETRSRFDNRFVTRELRELDLNRQREGRGTVLPLNRRERAKYITTTSFRLVSTEKVHLNRSAVFMVITTFKLMIHMIADYSLYWVLITIRHHGRFQSTLPPGIQDAGVQISGSGFAAEMLRSLIGSLNIPLMSPTPPMTCLPDPYPPDFRRYSQIGVLIILLWFFALFEPYGLRLRHMIMGHYQPERAKARALWLFNHILRTRGSFMKFARRRLHREYKYCSEAKFTFRRWLQGLITCRWLQSLFGISHEEPHCLLCGTIEKINDLDTQLIRCESPNCLGVFCSSCFSDIGKLCTICLSPADYGDQSDESLEKGSSDDNDSDDNSSNSGTPDKFNSGRKNSTHESEDSQREKETTSKSKFRYFSKKTDNIQENIPLLKHNTHDLPQNNFDYNSIQTKHKKHVNILDSNRNLMYRKRTISRQIDSSRTNLVVKNALKFKTYEINLVKKFGVVLSQTLVRHFKVFISFIKGKSIRNGKPKSNLTSRNVLTLNKRGFRRIRKLVLNKNVFNAYILCVFKNKKSKFTILKYIRRRRNNRYLKLGKYHNNKSRKSMQFSPKLESNYYKTVTDRDDDKKEPQSNNLNITKDETCRQNKPTKKKDLPEVNKKQDKTEKSNEKPKQNENKDDSDKTQSCTEMLYTLCTKYWKSLKLSMIPCTKSMSEGRKSISITNENRNFKHRKKENTLPPPLVKEPKSRHRKDTEDARNYRIESFLGQQQWLNYVFTQDIGHGDRKQDDVAINKALLKIKNKALSIKTKEAKSVGGIHLKSFPMNSKLNKQIIIKDDKDTAEKGIATSGYEMSYIKEDNDMSKRHGRSKEAIARFRNKITRKSTQTSLSEPYINKLVSAVNTSSTQDASPVQFRFADYYVSSCLNFYQSLGNSDESGIYNNPRLHNKYYQDVFKSDQIANKEALHCKDLDQNESLNEQKKAVCSKSYCKRVSKDDKLKPKHGHENKSSEDRIIRALGGSNLTQTVSGRFYDIGLGFKKPMSVLKELYSSLFGLPTEKGSTNKADKEGAEEVKKEPIGFIDKSINAQPSTFSCGCQCQKPLDQGPKMADKHDKNNEKTSKKLRDGHKCTCDANVNAVNETCTCATQYIKSKKQSGHKVKWFSRKNHHNEHHHQDHDNLSCKRCKSADTILGEDSLNTDTYTIDQPIRNRNKNRRSKKRSSSSISLQSISSIRSDETKTDTTVCSLATIDYRDERRHRVKKFKVKVITKANQSTLTDRKRVCDVSTSTEDWWSPMMEKRGKEISLEKKTGYTVQNQKNYERKHRRNMGISTDGRMVTFRSRAQIIPRETVDILSPSRYLLESQKYYNELFSSKFYAPHVFPVTDGMVKPNNCTDECQKNETLKHDKQWNHPKITATKKCKPSQRLHKVTRSPRRFASDENIDVDVQCDSTCSF